MLTLSTEKLHASKYSAKARSPRKWVGSLETRTVRAEIEWMSCNPNAWRDWTKLWKFLWKNERERKVKRYVNMRWMVDDVVGSRRMSYRLLVV